MADKLIVKIKHGSHMYGTDTANSDIDYKSVHLPSADKILLQTANKIIDSGTNKTNTKNSKDDVDEQSIPLQKFFQMIEVGDTVAIEILFAPDCSIVEKSYEWEEIREFGKSLINRKCIGFVSYCRRQAAKYGIKGSRMAACKAIVSLLERGVADNGTTAKLECLSGLLEGFVALHEFSFITEMPSNNGPVIKYLDVIDRKVPFTATIKNALDIYSKVYENYGKRAEAAMDNDGVDWKAVSHAVRVAEQAIELLNTRNITFPRPNAKYLLDIKTGKYVYKDIAKYLEEKVDEIETISLKSSYPEKTDLFTMNLVVMHFYIKQVDEYGRRNFYL